MWAGENNCREYFLGSANAEFCRSRLHAKKTPMGRLTCSSRKSVKKYERPRAVVSYDTRHKTETS